MNSKFTLEFLQDKIGAEYVEENPVTRKPRIIQALNEVWNAINEHGGVPQVAKLFGLTELVVWGWVDAHLIPSMYVKYLAGPGQRIADVQLSSVGFEDTESGACWPCSWRLEAADLMFTKNIQA